MTDAQLHDGLLPDGVDRASLDRDECVAADVPCVQCGYNLRTLPARQRCPECGQAVADSLIGPELAYASEQWVLALASGATFLSAAGGMVLLGLLLLVADLMSRYFGAVLLSHTFVVLSGILLTVGTPIAGLIGLHLLTAPDPDPTWEAEGLSVRRATRWSLVGGLILFGAAIARGSWLKVGVLLFIGAVPTMLLVHTAILARRARAPRLAAVGKALAASIAGLTVVMAVTACLPGWRPALANSRWIGIGACLVVFCVWSWLFTRMARVLRNAATWPRRTRNL